MKHTQGKWFVLGNWIKSRSFVIATIWEKKNSKQADANAERICLCVNGWDDLVKENNELDRLALQSSKRTVELTEQRDELLDACKEALQFTKGVDDRVHFKVEQAIAKAIEKD